MAPASTGIERPDFIDLATQGGDFGRGDAQAPWQAHFGARFTGQSILDVGAGLGHSRARLAVAGNVVTLQDLAPGMPVDVTDPVEALPDASYDVVTAFDVIEHIRDDIPFLHHLCRVARRQVVLTTPNWHVWRCGNPCHVREYTPAQLVDLCEREPGWRIAAFFVDRDGSGAAARAVPREVFLATTTEGGLAVQLERDEAVPAAEPGAPRTVGPARRAREIWVGGYPSHYGGADTELDHQIDLWLAEGVAVHLVPNGDPDPAMRADLTARGAVTHAYHPGIFAGKVVVSYCNGPFLERLPQICAAGRPREVLWANCMTWTFPAELAAHREGLIDRFLFQSRFQRAALLPALSALRPVRELEGYRPFFSVDRWSGGQAAAGSPPASAGYYGIGRISRDDGAKYPADLWRTWSRVTAPRPIKCFVLGWGPNARQKCGVPLEHHGLDWMLWSPGSVPARELYRRVHTLVHQTGGSRENWPRVAFEAWASGVAVLAEDDYAWPELIEDGVTGILCRSSDEFAFRASQLAFDEGLRQRIVTAARERLAAEHGDRARSFAAWRELV